MRLSSTAWNRTLILRQHYGGIRKAGQFEPVMTGRFDQLLESGNIAAKAVEAVDLALRRLAAGVGVTGGATYFANLDIVRQRDPNHWMLDPSLMVPTIKIGGHTFGRAGYQRGGYTGNYPVDQVVGVVHGQELVIPAPAVRKGLPGILEFLGVPGFQAGRMVDIPAPGSARLIVANMQGMFQTIGQTILGGLAKLFDIIARAIEALAVAFLGDERVEQIKSVFAELRQSLQQFIDSILNPQQKVEEEMDAYTEDVAGETNRLAMMLADLRLAFGNAMQSLVRRVPILSEAISAYQQAVAAAEEGGLGLGVAGGIAAAVMAALTASSEELGRAIDAVSEGFAALLQPLNALLEALGPTGAGAMVGAGVGFGAASLLGQPGLLGALFGGVLGLIGGAAQAQAEAAERQIEAAEKLVEAARQMNGGTLRGHRSDAPGHFRHRGHNSQTGGSPWPG